MAVLTPFRALRYAAPPAPDLSRLIAPPYDVIGPQERRRLASHPRNIVHVDLPEDGAAEPGYRRSAALLRRWTEDGTLVRDRSESLYVAEQSFREPGGVGRRRRGLIARLRLEPFANGVVIPHERTLEAPRADRTRLLAATRTHLSPIFLLHPDPGDAVVAATAAVAAGPPIASARIGDGEAVRLWRVTDREVIEGLVRRFADQWVLIADGHHRYESALAFQAGRAAAEEGHVLAFLCSVADPGLRVLPIHRVVRSLPDLRPAAARRALESWFDLVPVTDAAALPAAVEAESGRAGAFGLLFGGEPGGWLARWRGGSGSGTRDLEDLQEPLRRLDVVLLHRLVFERALGLDADRQAGQESLEYVKDAADLLERGRHAPLAVLLNPTRLDQVIEISRLGLRLPQKSTFFHPKVPTGLVLDPLDAVPSA